MNTVYKVMIAEDIGIVLENIVDIVRKSPLANVIEICATASDGASAHSMITRFNPDIVITDIHMPLMDGLQLLESLRLKKCRAIFIILTGHAQFEYAKKAVSLGVSEFLLKPLQEEELHAALAKAVSELSGGMGITTAHEPVDIGLNQTKSQNDGIPADDITSLEGIKRFIDNYCSSDLSLDTMATKFNMSPKYLSRAFKEKYGVNFVEYITDVRIDKSKDMLSKTDTSINEISQMLGFHSNFYFYKVFKKRTGIPPGTWRLHAK